MPPESHSTPPGFDSLTVDEQIRYVQNLWDVIAENTEDVPLSEEHRQVLRQRLDAHRRDPTRGRPWREAREELIKRLKDR